MIFDSSQGGDWSEMFDDEDDDDLDRPFGDGADSMFDDDDPTRGLGMDYFVEGKMLPGLKIYEVEYRTPAGETEFIEVVGDAYDQDERGNLHICANGIKMATWSHGVWLCIRYINSCLQQ